MIISFHHDSLEEWDGAMHIFAAKEILTGIGYENWASHFWPPLYPLLIALLGFFIPYFETAKLISILAGVFTLIAVYLIAIELYNNKLIGILTLLFVAENHIFLLSAVQAENHMLDTLFFLTVFLLLLKMIKLKGKTSKYDFLLGIFTGLACLTRYTSYALVPAVIISLLFLSERYRVTKELLLFFVGFAIISFPYWLYNLISNGSPFHSWQYMNIGARLYPPSNEWWWNKQANFNDIFSIFLVSPSKYLSNVIHNIFESFKIIVVYSSSLSLFVIPSLFYTFYSLES